MGVGNFFGMLPENMRGSRLYGVELDSITGRIAQQLYPKANITIAGFETTDRRDFFDLAVGDVPFGQYKVNDPAYNKLGFNIHNYFFAKALDQVRPGGVVAFVTSRYTMDAQNPSVRRYLAQRADLLGAIRLPNNAFKANAGTEVVSDILFLQKRDRAIDIEPDWVHLGQTEDGYAINSYFLDHPEMVMCRNSSESTAHGMDYTVEPLEDISLADQLHEAVRHMLCCLQLRDIRGNQYDIRKSLGVWKPEMERYMNLVQQIKEKSKKRTALTKEKKELPVIRVLRSRELAAQIAELTEELEELRSEKNRLLERFSYEDASAPAAFRREIAAMENSLKKLTVQEKKYSNELEKAIAEYRNLKAQSADIDPVELYNVQQSIRPEHEQDAQRRYTETRGMEPTMNDVLDARYNTERLLHEREEKQIVRQVIADRERLLKGNEKKGCERDREER